FSDRNGTAFASIHKKIFTDIYRKDFKSVSIQLEVLDAFLEENKIETIDFLKTDTEGNDFNVLLGAQKALKNKAIKIIQFEFNETYIYSGVFIKDFKNLFKDYNLYRILTHGIIPLDFDKPVDYEIFLFQNILAIQKDIDKLK
ncbi:MAG TPA: FkbM family methyltransferase, partial [Draconibacterium sp.]|nr:FkbM family methyltransferase [Draconibacterium sp.]